MVNSCGVKDPTERKVLRELARLEDHHPWATVVTGCLPSMSLAAVKAAHPSFGAILDTKSTHLFGSVLDRLEWGERQVEVFAKQRGTVVDKVEVMPFPTNPLVGILTINEGCDGACTFCGTKLARGKTQSYPPHTLLRQASLMLEGGAKELWVTSQDSGAYSYNDGERTWHLPELLDSLARLPHRFRLRLGMINPEHMVELELGRSDNTLLDVFDRHPNIYQFFHIPVQSGNDRVLELMKRRYTVAEFQTIVGRVRSRFPSSTISTDIIVGFPTEAEDEFRDTLRLVEWLRPPVMNVSRYGARPGTVASAMEGQVHPRISKEWSRELKRVWEPIAQDTNDQWVGWEGKVLVVEEGKNLSGKPKEATVIGRNFAYRPIVLPAAGLALGSFVPVKITHSRVHYFFGAAR